MIITAALMVAIGSSFIEIKLIHAVPAITKAYINGIGPVPGVWVNFAVSFMLSYVMGIAFGAAGLIAFMGGLLSTGITKVYLDSEDIIHKAGWDIPRVKSTSKEKSEEVALWWENNQVHFINLGKTIMVTIKVITAPLRWAIAANNAAHNGKDKVTEFRSTAQAKIDSLRKTA